MTFLVSKYERHTYTLIELSPNTTSDELSSVSVPRTTRERIFGWLGHFDSELLGFDAPDPELRAVFRAAGDQVVAVRRPRQVRHTVRVTFQCLAMRARHGFLESMPRTKRSVLNTLLQQPSAGMFMRLIFQEFKLRERLKRFQFLKWDQGSFFSRFGTSTELLPSTVFCRVKGSGVTRPHLRGGGASSKRCGAGCLPFQRK